VHRISGWIFEGNLTKVVEYVAALVNYSWDEHQKVGASGR
jgi:hypothetical protein